MRKLYSLFAIFAMFLSFASCEDQPAPGPDVPSEGIQPEISIVEKAVEPNSFTFEVTTNVAGELGYCIVRSGYEAPSVDEWFSANTVSVEDKLEITVNDLSDNSEYTLYAILRAGAAGFSNPVTHQFTTPDDGQQSPIDVINVTYSSITFAIAVPGKYLFQCIDKAYIEAVGQTPESYISTPGIGIPSSGEQTIDWVDGGVFSTYDMRVREDSDYYIIVAITDSSYNIVGDIFVESLHTPKRPESQAALQIELSDITSTSVNIKSTPDSTIEEYYILVRDKAWSDEIADNPAYGESMLAVLVKYPSAGSWHLSEANESVWAGLIPSTEYYCHVVAIDNKGAQSFERIPFTTSEATLAAPQIEAAMTPDSEMGHYKLNLQLFSAEAASAKVAFYPTADIADMRKENKSDEQIAAEHGVQLNDEQIADIRSIGHTLIMENLYPDTEYTAIISVRNGEQTETLKVTACKTLTMPIPTRVESDLFTTLLGDWTVSYSLVQYNGESVTISNAPVTIAQGVDAKSNTDYRNQNRLVITGWPFSVSASGQLQEMPFYAPSDLMESDSYWRDYPSLAYRDYGPKIFLEIAAGDVVTVPSDRSNYFYNWSYDGTFYFFGCDLGNELIAPASFPVTVSADGNTLTIGACYSGEEFGYGVYRPSVFRGSESWAIATSDIVLKRVN